MAGGTLYAGLGGLVGDGGLGLNGGGPNGYTVGLAVGSWGCQGTFNQSGGVTFIHGDCYFGVGADPAGGLYANDGFIVQPTTASAGTGTYNLSGGTLNSSEGGQGFGTGTSGSWSLIGFLGGAGTMNVSGGVWNIAADGTESPLSIGTGDTTGNFTGPGTSGTVNITGGTVNACCGVLIGDVFAVDGPQYQGAMRR